MMLRNLLFFSLAFAQPALAVNANEFFNLEVIEAEKDYTVVEFSLKDYELQEMKELGENISKVTVPGLTNHGEKGDPDLPRLRRNILIPEGASLSLEVESVNYDIMPSVVPTPNRGMITRNQNPSEVPYVFSSFYKQRSIVSPTKAMFARLAGEFTLRSSKGVSLEINPFAYSPGDQSLYVLRSLTVKVLHKSRGPELLSKRAENDPMISSYEKLYLNGRELYKKFELAARRQVEESTLVISANLFKELTSEFVEAKKAQGYSMFFESVASDTPYTDIKALIDSYYRSYPSLMYVLLVGDAEHLAFHPGQSGNAYGNEADPMYGLMDGEDSYPELIVARMSAQNDRELENIFERSLNYSSMSGDWQHKGIGIASDEGSPTDFERADWLKNMLEADVYSAVDQHYDPGVEASDIVASINEGRSLINYIGHGSSTAWITGNFSVNHIRELDNVNKLPVIVSVACVNGDFNYRYGDSFAEAWLKAGSANSPKGAIVVFASSTNQSWVPPTVGQHKISQLISERSEDSIGKILMQGSVAVLEDASSTAEQTFETWHIFGDPTLRINVQ